MKKIALLVPLCFLIQPAHAINKCVDGAGQTTYQEEPCAASMKATRFQSWDVQGDAEEKGSAAKLLELKARVTDMERARRQRETAYENERQQREIAVNAERGENDDDRRAKEWDWYVQRAQRPTVSCAVANGGGRSRRVDCGPYGSTATR